MYVRGCLLLKRLFSQAALWVYSDCLPQFRLPQFTVDAVQCTQLLQIST